MPLRLRHWLPTALMLPLFLLPTWGDVPDAPPLGACYMGYGKMLEAAQSRQLSLNAHVIRFLYQPGGLEIAYEGSQKDGNQITQFIRLAGVKRGMTTTLTSSTSRVSTEDNPAEPITPPYSLASWSGDGRYLLISQQRFVTTSTPEGSYLSENFQCVDVGVDPIRVLPVALPEPQSESASILSRTTHYWWSPDRTRLLFAMEAHLKQGEEQHRSDLFCSLYDPKTGKTQDITHGEKQIVRGWLDGNHLLLDDSQLPLEVAPSRKVHSASYDITTGTQAEIPPPAKMPPLFDDIRLDDATRNNLSPKAAYLRLDDETRQLQDQQKVSAVSAHALWVRRTQGPKTQSAAPVGLTPGESDPQAIWSPTGTQIAFIAHGDLFVTDLTMRDATAVEKYAAGEKLTCPEERDLAASNLKQVGLAMLQYCQDWDENFPPASGWQDSVSPYLKDTTLFSAAGHPVVYHTPANLTLASIDAPAETVLGTVDLPCATVTLYFDGHVKALPKAVAAPDLGNDR